MASRYKSLYMPSKNFFTRVVCGIVFYKEVKILDKKRSVIENLTVIVNDYMDKAIDKVDDYTASITEHIDLLQPAINTVKVAGITPIVSNKKEVNPNIYFTLFHFRTHPLFPVILFTNSSLSLL